MQAVQFVLTVPRYVFGLVAGRLTPAAYTSPFCCTRLREVPPPSLPGPDWVKIKTRYGGICASEMNIITLHANISLSPFGPPIFTLGHEQVGTIAEVGEGISDLVVGQRVTVDPLLPCPTRGVEEFCPSCRRGEYSQCENFAAGAIGTGYHLGAAAATGGSWSPYFVAHRFQVFPIPDTVSDENALLAEPLSVAIHPVMRTYPADDETALVLGAGVLGICVVASLRALGSKARILVLAKHRYQAEWAKHYGADEAVLLGEGDYFQRIADLTGGTLHQPMMGKRIMVGGADVVYECVGHDQSIDDALRFARPGARLAMIGFASVTKKVDWTPLWFSELQLRGSSSSGSLEVYGGEHKRPVEIALEWLAEGRLDMSPLVTHTYALDDYKRAIREAMHKSRYKMVKAAFAF